jgi:DNA polymerase III delta prime subunit
MSLLHENIYNKLDYFYKNNKIPHIIFHGSSGSGKRTIMNNFLDKIYQGDHKKIKTNVMLVNCAHGKGIKFIREELKFFAKTNVQSNTGVLFKSIVLLNADNLTIDAQSALRRCIELFSSNTRFFIIVENKHKLLNPILSRFCEIYVPEKIVDGKFVNLHQQNIEKEFDLVSINKSTENWISEKMKIFATSVKQKQLIELADEFYENGYSCIDFVKWLENCESMDNHKKSDVIMHFDKIKSEYRCERLLLFCIFDFMREME